MNDTFREIDSRFEREFHEKLQLRASDSKHSVQQGQQLVRGSALRRSFQSSENFDSPEPLKGVSVSVQSDDNRPHYGKDALQEQLLQALGGRPVLRSQVSR